MTEKPVEAALVTAATKTGGRAFKWTGEPGVPDRIVLLPVPEEHREIVGRYVRFVECKSPTGKLSALQKYVLSVLTRLGYRADVVASVESAREAVA